MFWLIVTFELSRASVMVCVGMRDTMSCLGLPVWAGRSARLLHR